MSSTNKSQKDLILNNSSEGDSIPLGASIIDTQVKVKKSYRTRRTFDTAYKVGIISAYNDCENASDRGALLRKEGLYHTRIYAWKQQLENSKLTHKKQTRNALRADHLTRENEQLKKKLAHAEAIIDIQKKISELLGTHILPLQSDESKS